MNIALIRQKFPEYFQPNIQDTLQSWLFACSFTTGNIACQISSAFSSPQCNDKIFRRKRCMLSGIGPLFVLVKVHRTNDFSHNSSHINYFLVLYRLFLSKSLFYNIFRKRKLTQINSSGCESAFDNVWFKPN